MGTEDDTSRTGGPATLAARLQGVRQRGFVGRTDELERFRSALQDELPPFAVLFVHGPGGVGKSALLSRFEQEARDAGRTPVSLDGRSVDPTPQGLLAALGHALGVPEGDAVATLAGRERAVVVIDTYELLGSVDGFVRHTLLPQLNEDVVVVIAGRDAPQPGWRSDPGWQDLVQEVALRDLPPEAARALLSARGVPEDRHAEALAVARGHPLALVLVAEVLAQRPPGRPFSLTDAPDVIQALLRRFLQDVPSPAHRDTLLACAHATVASELLLREVVDDTAGHDLFAWLRDLPFSELLPDGVALHALVAEVLDAEARWRDPDYYEQVHQRVSRHLGRRIANTAGRAQHRAMQQLIRLHRFSPVARQFFDFDAAADDEVWVEAATAEDRDAIIEMAARHEGVASADVARWWLDHQPEAFTVFRTPGTRRPTGFIAHVRLGDQPGDEVEADPVVAAVWRHIRTTAPMRPGEQVLVVRYWVDERTHQGIATHHLVSTTAARDWVTTPGLAWAFVVLHEPEFWAPMFTFIDFRPVADVEVTIGDHHHGLFARDWRATSVAAWVQLVTQRMVSPAEHDQQLPPVHERLQVLSEEEFRGAVRDALRGYARPDGLGDNPLLQTRLVVDHAGGRTPAETLARLLEEATAALAEHPRDEPRRRALELTYLRPSPTQEAAAERLGLPSSTFRRHLTEGVDRVVTWLWERELRGHGTGS